MSEFRYNPATRDWVIIAPERARRPHAELISGHPESPAYSPDCPFCPGQEQNTPDETLRLSGSDGHWRVRAFPNSFPVVHPVTPEGLETTGDFGRLHRPAVGRHEVVAESHLHNANLATLYRSDIQQVVRAWVERYRALAREPGIEHVILFKNHGQGAGSSLQHPHSQLVSLPLRPAQVQMRMEEAAHSFSVWGRCLYCQMLQAERTQQVRMVVEGERFSAFVPYAAFSPYSVWLFPHRHSSSFASVEEEDLDELSRVLQDVLRRLYHALADPSYNLVVRSIPREVSSFHWYLAVVPRTAQLAGFEMGTGMFINSHLPEEDARQLREVI